MKTVILLAIIASLLVLGCQKSVSNADGGDVVAPPAAVPNDGSADVASVEQAVSADDVAAIDQDLSDLDSLGSDLEPSEFNVDTQI